MIAGHSAGGQFANRFAAAHPAQPETRYIVANPSSYLYLDAQRREDLWLDKFSIPKSDVCFNYNHYKYGTEILNAYMLARGPLV